MKNGGRSQRSENCENDTQGMSREGPLAVMPKSGKCEQQHIMDDKTLCPAFPEQGGAFLLGILMLWASK